MSPSYATLSLPSFSAIQKGRFWSTFVVFGMCSSADLAYRAHLTILFDSTFYHHCIPRQRYQRGTVRNCRLWWDYQGIWYTQSSFQVCILSQGQAYHQGRNLLGSGLSFIWCWMLVPFPSYISRRSLRITVSEAYMNDEVSSPCMKEVLNVNLCVISSMKWLTPQC